MRPFRAHRLHLLVVFVVAVLALTLSSDRSTAFAAVPRLTFWEPGGRVAPMSSVRLRLASEQEAITVERSARIVPSVPGQFVRLGRILEFRPDAPGFARGATYRIDSEKGALMSFQVAEALSIVRRSPDDGDDEIGTRSVLLVQFNTTVQPLTAIDEAPNAPVVRIDPPVAGTGQWLTSSMYRFRPTVGWEPSTRYTVALLPGVTGLEGETQSGSQSWSFTTVSPAVADVFPAPGASQASPTPNVPRTATPVRATPTPGVRLGTQAGQPASPNARITVQFNQPVNRAAAERALSFNPAIPGTIAWTDDQTMVLTPSGELQRAATYTGTVAAGVPSANGLAASREPFTWGFTTAGLPGISGTAPREGEETLSLGSINLRFQTPMDRESVESRITLDPKPERDVFFSWSSDDTSLFLSFPGLPSTSYRLALAGGSRDRFGQVIEGPFVLGFRTAALRPSLDLTLEGRSSMHFGPGKPKAVLTTTNVRSVDLTLYRTGQEQFLELLARQGFGQPLEGADELWKRSVEIRDYELNRRATTAIEVGDETLPPGYYLLAAPVPGGTNDDIFVLPFVVTRTHLTLKESSGELLVWAVDATTGNGVPEMPLRVLRRSGNTWAERASGRTDAQGIATFTPATSDDQILLGERAGDVVIVREGWGQSGGFPYVATLTGQVVTDRPLYRPGETVRFRAIVRRDDDAALTIPDAVLSWSIRDSRFREFARGNAVLDEFGAFDAEAALEAAAATGGYTINVTREGQQQSFASISFQVAEFRRPEFTVELKPERGDYANGEQIGLTATAKMFLGAPLSSADVRWRVTSAPLSFSSADFPGYSFNDPDDLQAPTPQVRPAPVAQTARASGEGRTNAEGTFTFAVPADVSKDPTGQVFTVEATVIDVDNQQISARATVRMHKAARYAGIRPRGYVGIAERPLDVDLATVDRMGKAAGGEDLSIRIVERRWSLVRVRQDDGRETQEYRPDDREVETRSVRTGPDGRVSFSFTPPRGGFYRIVASGRDAAGNAYHSAAGIYVSGPGTIPWRDSTENRLELVADKTVYQPGDVARVLVPAPFAGATGLVTIERQGILSREVRPFETNSTVLEIPIERRHMPNVFVSVSLFKPVNADGPAAYRVGHLELSVSAEEQHLTVTLTPDREKLGPREEVTFDVVTTDAQGNPVAAELAMALVDEAVLSLVGTRPVDAHGILYRRHTQGVRTSASSGASLATTIRRQATPARTATPAATAARTATAAPAPAAALPQAPGQAPEEEAQIDPRTDFRFTAEWKPSVRTDSSGRGRLTVRLPDTLTTWRLIAHAITPDSKAGLAQSTIVTQKPLVVRPVAPRFFTAGDRPDLGAVVFNFTDAPLDVRVSLRAEGVTLEGEAAFSARLAPGDRWTGSWRTAVPPSASGSKVTWTVTGGGLSDAVELSLPVYALATPEVVASSGAVTGRTTEVVRGPGAPGARATDVTLELFPSLTSMLPETVRYLRDYPWLHTEAAASRLLTTIGVARARGERADPAVVQGYVNYLYNLQRQDGGWGWWLPTDNEPSDPYMTAYAVLALGAARDAGYPVDAQRLNRPATVLRTELDRSRDVRFPLNPNRQAWLAYALVTAQPNEMDRVFNLATRRDTLGPEGKALLAIAMYQQRVEAQDPRLRPLLSDLISAATISAAAAHWDDPVSGPARLTTATRATALALWALTFADFEHPLVDDAIRWLMNERREGRWASTQDSALSVLALGAVAEARGEGGASYAYRVQLNDEEIRAGAVENAARAPADRIVMREQIRPGDNPLVISRQPADAPGRLYYTLNYQYALPAQGISARDRGVAVAREYLSTDGEDRPLRRVKAGDLVKVRVTVLASGTMNYVQVEDFLPAGLEPVDVSLKTTSREILEKLGEEARSRAERRDSACRFYYSFYYCYSPFTHSDLRDDRVGLFARSLPKGTFEYTYFARATTPGTYQVRPAHVSEVYFPDVWGRTDSGVFVVEP